VNRIMYKDVNRWQQIEELYEQGKRPYEISQITGVSLSDIKAVLHPGPKFPISEVADQKSEGGDLNQRVWYVPNVDHVYKKVEGVRDHWGYWVVTHGAL